MCSCFFLLADGAHAVAVANSVTVTKRSREVDEECEGSVAAKVPATESIVGIDDVSSKPIDPSLMVKAWQEEMRGFNESGAYHVP